MINDKLLKILACPVCRSDLYMDSKKLFCKMHCKVYYDIGDGIIKLLPHKSDGKYKEKIIKKNVRELFDSVGDYDKYSHASGIVGEYEENEERINVLNKLELKNGSLVLDAACGNGRFLELTNNPSIIGLDLSLNLLNDAKKKGLKNIFILGDLENLPFKDSVFDEVFTVRVLGHLPNIDNAINEISRVLKKNGRVVIMDYNRYSLFYTRVLLKPFVKKLRDINRLSGWNKYYSIWNLKKLFKKNDLEIVSKGYFLFAHLDFFKFKKHDIFIPKMLIKPLLNFGKFIDNYGPNFIKKFSSRIIVVVRKK